jgi:hypothetical protein
MNAAIPLGLLAFAAILITYTGLVVSEEEDAPVVDCDGLEDILSCPGSILLLIGQILTFNIDGAPWWVRLPMALMMTVPFGYILLAIIFEGVPG